MVALSSSPAPRLPPSMPSAVSKRPSPSRRRLSNAQKIELCEFYLANKHMDTLELSIWAANHFKLGLPPGTRTVSRILSNYGELRKIAPEMLDRKAMRSEPLLQIDAQLRQWIGDLYEQGLHVNGEMIKDEAARLYTQAQESADRADQRALLQSPKFSNGWLSCFLDRSGISLKNMQSGRSPFDAAPRKKKANAKRRAPAAPLPRHRVAVDAVDATSPSESDVA